MIHLDIFDAVPFHSLHHRANADCTRRLDPKWPSHRVQPPSDSLTRSASMAMENRFYANAHLLAKVILFQREVEMAGGKLGPFHLAFYTLALFFGGRLGWHYVSEYGTILGLIGAIAGAVILSSLVGVVAGLFGYRP